jgi:hypothetical protein
VDPIAGGTYNLTRDDAFSQPVKHFNLDGI